MIEGALRLGYYRFDGVVVDEARGDCRVDGQSIHLRPKTFAVLCRLLSAGGELVTLEEIIRAVWPRRTLETFLRTNIDVHLRMLRCALGPRHAWRIVTVARRGYRFDGAFESGRRGLVPSVSAELVDTSARPFAALDAFIAAVDETNAPDELAAVIRRQIERLGFDLYAYQLVRPREDGRIALFATNFPTAWTARYIEARHIRHDPVSMYATQAFRPFLWHQIAQTQAPTDRQRQVFNEASEFGLTSGGVVPVAGPGATAALFGVSNLKMRASECTRLFMAHRHELQVMASYIHERMLRIGTTPDPHPEEEPC